MNGRRTGRGSPDVELAAYLAVSLDGFIARPDGAMDWLRGGGRRPPKEERSFRTFVASVDAIAMGRATFETVRDLPVWPYESTPVIVLSHRSVQIPQGLSKMVEAMSGAPAELVLQFQSRGWQRVYIDGGKTIQGFLAAGLMRRLVLNRVPVLLGSGRPLFGHLPGDLWVQHTRTESYLGGLVQSEYEITSATERKDT